jgi:ABC-2 type transport system permease protein
MMSSTATLVSDSLVLARRNLEHIRQVPERLLDVTLQPLMFVLLFGYVFGGVIHISGGSYHEYLLGGIMVQTVAFGLIGPALALATDLGEGILDRFRSLPMRRPAFLFGHIIASMGAALLAVAIIAGSGLVIGWRIHTDVPHALAGFGLLILFSFAMIWVGAVIGLIVRSPDAVMGLAFMVVFPLTFLSNAFVPADGLPSVLRTISAWNPVSAMVAAVRDLFGNPTAVPHDPSWPLRHPVFSAVLGCLVLLAVMIPLALHLFQAKTTD